MTRLTSAPAARLVAALAATWLAATGLAACDATAVSEDASSPATDARAPAPDASVADAEAPAVDGGFEPGPCAPAPAAEGVYPDDPELVARLAAIPARTAMRMPETTVNNMGFTGYDSQKGPPGRDYSNAMVFAPERHTALYAGGSHGTYRANDVWEYHLASNTWHMLFYPVGGNVGPYKAGHFAVRRWRDGGDTPDAETMERIDAFVGWAREHTEFRDGQYTTHMGGPIMPSHQWDGLTYEPRLGRMVWRSGAHSAFSAAAIAYILELDEAEVEAALDTRTTPMWTFDPATARWEWYRHDGETPRASLRGMGASATYVPDLCAVVHYAAAQNVTPPVFEMWSHDVATDEWTDLRPNDGASIRQLVVEDGVAPSSEAQMAYSPVSRTLVAVLGAEAYAYDLDANEWTHLTSDDRIDAHDARTVFVYDSRNDVFLLHDERAPDRVHALSLETGEWEAIVVEGDAFPPPPYGNPFGYYDPIHNLFVVANARNRGVWVFRYA